MIENRSSEVADLRERAESMQEYLHLDARREELAALEERSSCEGFWDEPEKAQRVMAKAASIRDDIESYEKIISLLDDAEVANELAVDGSDENLANELAGTIRDIEVRIDELELASWFDGEFDSEDAIVTILPGQGGLEAQDWTEMLLKMYMKYAESKGWKVTLNDAPAGQEIGLDRATFTVSGKNAYGMLNAEQGVHRLVRISPTDEKKRRQTTFAGVEVLPVLPDDLEVEINPEDVRIDVYRSSGPGGQSVNTTDSAVRLTHTPTGTVVTCQNEKSQLQNKESAFKILKSKLYEIEKAKREEELNELRGPKKSIGFGSQIRSYVLYPYQMVKDLRTGVETGNVDAVLGGDIDDFIVGFHKWRVQNEAE